MVNMSSRSKVVNCECQDRQTDRQTYSSVAAVFDCRCRFVKNKDEANATVSRQAIEAKLPYLLQFLSNADDDVSGTVAPFAHDYVTLLKQTTPLSDCQKEFVKVCVYITRQHITA